MGTKKGAQGEMGREKIIPCSTSSRAAVCFTNTTGDESDKEQLQ